MKPLHIFYALLVATIWGVNFIASKYALAHFPPFFATFLRFTLVAAILVPLVKMPNASQMRHIALLSTVLVVGHFALLQASLAAELDIASCTIITQLGVPFSCLLGVVFKGDKLGLWRISGLVLAFIGMVLVLGTPNVENHWLGTSFALVAAFLWGVANLQMKSHEEIGVFQMLGWMGLFALPQLFLITTLFENPSLALIANTPLDAALSMLFTVTFSTFLAYGLWYFLIKRYAMSLVAPFSLITPIVGIYLGQLMFGETLNALMIFGGLLTLMGVAIIVIRRPKIISSKVSPSASA